MALHRFDSGSIESLMGGSTGGLDAPGVSSVLHAGGMPSPPEMALRHPQWIALHLQPTEQAYMRELQRLMRLTKALGPRSSRLL